MPAAGGEVVRRALGPGTLGNRPATDLAAAIYAAMSGAAWRPIDTAPQDGTDVLFGLWRDGTFLRGIGRWQVYDEPDKPGFWSVTDWFGAPPSHWMPMPAPPKE